MGWANRRILVLQFIPPPVEVGEFLLIMVKSISPITLFSKFNLTPHMTPSTIHHPMHEPIRKACALMVKKVIENEEKNDEDS